ncbi:uncharacterized protein [Gossypium hirsutum]|uniref:Uncharacterized protein isoform X2 n=1 Tax=Gossypium hirsutum TaxID=3635 RepID=A0A1U8KKW5_GOSHI|nr:uncharacterized protein LOC107916582 isoform X2 [Gossypium hirsutum]
MCCSICCSFCMLEFASIKIRLLLLNIINIRADYRFIFFFVHFFITVRESPSKITYFIPNSFPTITACKHAKASAANLEEILSWMTDFETNTSPLKFLTITLEQDIFFPLSKGASKLILRNLLSGAFHESKTEYLAWCFLSISYSPNGADKDVAFFLFTVQQYPAQSRKICSLVSSPCLHLGQMALFVNLLILKFTRVGR